jgi:hypothetical protein
MAVVKKSVWSVGCRIAGAIVFIFSLLQLPAPAWARGMAAIASSKPSQTVKPEADSLMESFLRESRFSNREISSRTGVEPWVLAQSQKATTNGTQPKQAMTKQDTQPKQAMKLAPASKTSQPKQAMKLAPANRTSQPKQAMKLAPASKTSQPKQAMKLAPASKTSQPKQAMKLAPASKTSQPKQAMKLAPANRTSQPQQAMKLKQGEPGAKQ